MCITICSPPGSAPAAEGFALAGSRPLGCLLIHVFTATPDEMRPLGEALAARGFPVRAVRLAGHGTRVADLAATRWAEWFASVAEGADRLRRDVPALAVAGMSLGALLALHLAATRPSEVSALVLCGTPLKLGGAGARWLPLLARIPWIARRWATIPKPGGPDIAGPASGSPALPRSMLTATPRSPPTSRTLDSMPFEGRRGPAHARPAGREDDAERVAHGGMSRGPLRATHAQDAGVIPARDRTSASAPAMSSSTPLDGRDRRRLHSEIRNGPAAGPPPRGS